MPYDGVQINSVSSPDAGTTGVASVDDAENAAVEDLEETQFAAGVTILRRLVPGWFLSINLGTDQISGGFSIEF